MSPATDKTILSIDYGTKRIGLAKSDSLGMIASALTTLDVKSMKDAVTQVRSVIDNIKPSAIVIGYPMLASGDRGSACDEIDRFIDRLTEFYEGPIHRVDEADSSDEAKEIVKAHGKRPTQDKKRIDRLAAVIILQRYLDETGAIT